MTGAVVIFVVLIFLFGMPWPLALLLAWLWYEVFTDHPKREDRP
jgi:membrane protein insertase Oxa1/YidC/SpoIIIJ